MRKYKWSKLENLNKMVQICNRAKKQIQCSKCSVQQSTETRYSAAFIKKINK